MKSMTGFGSAQGRAPGRRLQIEISSVNSKKGLDLQINLPRELAVFESDLRSLIQDQVTRGRIVVDVHSRTDALAPGPRLRIDTSLIKAYNKQCLAAAREAGVDDSVSLEFLLRLPGVITEPHPELDMEALKEPLLATAAKALAAFQKSREREGVFLCKDLGVKFSGIEQTAAAIGTRKTTHVQAYRQALLKRLKDSGLEIAFDDERLTKELALFADRSDISEELTRLAAHGAEARRLLKSKTPIGRNLDFLLQEIGREVNTIGSKANDLEISRAVVAIKTELEKIREQVQNLE
jgi:uncharacterized protein (TIGR00255 family)